MADASLLEDLKLTGTSEEEIEKLRAAGIVTYGRLLAVIGDEQAEESLRAELCFVLVRAHRYIDRRRAAGPLLAALGAGSGEIRRLAAFAAGMLSLRRAVPTLRALAEDRSQPHLTRYHAIQALGMMQDERALTVIRAIVADETESAGERAVALEQTASYEYEGAIAGYIGLLGHESPDLRFWAAYCLGQMRYSEDIAPALDALDRAAAEDHHLPEYWGWHIDREALLAVEFIHFRTVKGDPEALPEGTWIISPAIEFDDFIRTYRHWNEDWTYSTDPVAAIRMRVDRGWLEERLRKQWPDVAIGVREPRARTYVFDFRVEINGRMVIGGLHRDRYALVLTGDRGAMCEIAAWYRRLFLKRRRLYLYEWGDGGVEIGWGMTAGAIEREIMERDG